MNPVETYLSELKEIRSYGVAVEETSFYGMLESLLNEIGKTLKPKVKCIINLRNAGAGIPDGGLFTPDQKNPDMAEGTVPSRGAIEVKGIKDNVSQTVKTEQVQKYLNRYGQVLVTNYWDFVLVGRDERGKPEVLESYRLAENEADFRAKLLHPRKMADEQEDGLTEFLKRVMLRVAELTEPKDVAWLLASYARDARRKVEASKNLDALTAVRTALEEALGLKFEGEKGEHFFRSTLVQTLFYGIFSAWVLWAKDNRRNTDEKFDWQKAAWDLHVPMIKALFEQVATPSRLGSLGLVEILDSAGAALNRVKPAEFFSKFEEQHAVQYFYEPFLEAFDPQLRKELGVWYTPPEIVQYMVARVDAVLRQELGVEDGLADPQVYVLDPACGTGAYLVEVLRHIEATLRAKGDETTVGLEVKRAATDRVFGFEILPAPFVVAHLQLGLMMKNLDAPFSDEKHERAGVFLTNSLTGWEPPTEEVKKKLEQLSLTFPEMKQEHDAAQKVKNKVPILVILGNPPYNGYAGMAVSEERELSTAYRTTKRAPAPQGQGLNDLYVRFFRMAERRIVEKSGEGVVCFISNYSWLDGLSFTGMRERYLEEFDEIWIDNLNGDKYKTGKLTPSGDPDPSVFSTEFNHEGIQVGTAIALLARRKVHVPANRVQFRNLWGKTKLDQLHDTAINDGTSLYAKVVPHIEVGLPFVPMQIEVAYLSWSLLPDLFPVSFPGVKTSRDDVVVDIDRDRLVERMERYFDPNISDEEVLSFAPGAMTDAAGFDARSTRRHLLKRGFLPQNVTRYCYRPFDNRWLYWEGETKLLDRMRPEYFPQVYDGNVWLAVAQKNRKEFDAPFVTKHLGSLHIVERGANMFPLYLRPDGKRTLFDDPTDVEKPNLSDAAAKYLAYIGANAEDLFYHALAVPYSPEYRDENAGALRQDWPRIPLPDSRGALFTSAALGRQVAALLDMESPVGGVTSGDIRPELRMMGVLSLTENRGPDSDTDFQVTAGWGHAGKDGVTMPAKGKYVSRAYNAEELRSAGVSPASLRTGAVETPECQRGESFPDRSRQDASATGRTGLGETTLDIYLNNTAYWKNVPSGVWEYHIGGYQVIKKWLSYREMPLLGRPLTLDEVKEVMNMVRRIAAIRLLEPALDANYQAVKAATYSWPIE